MSSQLNICAFQSYHLFVTLFASIFCSVADYALFQCYLGQICITFGDNLASKFFKFTQKQHLLMVLFGTNLVRNISTFLMQMRCRFNTHFNWGSALIFFSFCFFSGKDPTIDLLIYPCPIKATHIDRWFSLPFCLVIMFCFF